MPETHTATTLGATRRPSRTIRAVPARLLMAVLAVGAMLAVSVTSVQAQEADVANTDGHIGFVTIEGSNAGWVVEDNTRTWLSPSCRAELEAKGVTFAVAPWSELSSLDRGEPGPCPEAGPRGPRFVQVGDKKGSGWVLMNGTRAWVAGDCRADLEAAGIMFPTVTWSDIAELRQVRPSRCEQYLPDTTTTRFATFNASLNRDNAGDLVGELTTAAYNGTVTDQLAAVLQIISITSPDVLLINEFDYDTEERAAELMAMLTDYPYWYTAPSNTGVASGMDLDNSGDVGGPGDAYGFGFHEGQFGMLVLSRYPIITSQIRTFQNFLWKDMPGALLPTNPDGSAWYSPEELDGFRLSSKSHWDVPVRTPGGVVHFLVSHPTPPVFDGPEDRNGTRNHDEIRLWADYVQGEGYMYDDNGVWGGLGEGMSFVIAGDQNSDPNDGDSIPGAAQLLLNNPRVNTSTTPAAVGGVEAAAQGAPNESHATPPRFDTADFGEAQFGGPGNLRVDYVLPSTDLTITGAAVFWPGAADPFSVLTGNFPFPASDHRLVWVDVN